MPQILDALETRIVSIMEQNRGGTGMSSDAAARALPDARWRRSVDNAALRDPRYEPTAFDRAYELDWSAIGDFPDVENPLDGTTLRELWLNLNVGHAYGVAASNQVDIASGTFEDAATSVINAKKRALSDAERIKRALTFSEIFSGALGSSITWVGCVRRGRTTTEDLGGGKLLSVTPYQIIISQAPSVTYDP